MGRRGFFPLPLNLTINMKRINTLILILHFVPTLLSAQNIEDLYMMWARPTHNQYYILEQEISARQNKTTSLTYDITYLDTLLYTTYRCTFSHPNLQKIDSVIFTSNNLQIISRNPKLLYVEAMKGGWAHRYEMYISLEHIKKMYDPQAPVQVTIYTDKGSFRFQEPVSPKWKKKCQLMAKIFQIISLNKH